MKLAATYQADRRDSIPLPGFWTEHGQISASLVVLPGPRTCHGGAGEPEALTVASGPRSVAVTTEGCPLVLQRRATSSLLTWVAPSSVPSR